MTTRPGQHPSLLLRWCSREIGLWSAEHGGWQFQITFLAPQSPSHLSLCVCALVGVQCVNPYRGLLNYEKLQLGDQIRPPVMVDWEFEGESAEAKSESGSLDSH